MLTIDGSMGEGGGQILRTALSLSLTSGRAVRVEKIRAGRQKPGLHRQHLAAVEAARQVSGARVEGAEPGSMTLTFAPKDVRHGDLHIVVGGAGSATLVLQTVLPALMILEGTSNVVVEGGTHNPKAPPFEFLADTLAPLLRSMGPGLDLQLERHGFYPRGGGRLRATVSGVSRLTPLTLLERGPVEERRARALVAGLPLHVAERELDVLRRALELEDDELEPREVRDALGPGNIVTLELRCEHVTETLSGFGERGLPAESVAEGVVHAARRYLAARVPVGEHLADQLLVPMALAGGGSFLTTEPTSHMTTCAAAIEQLLGVRTTVTRVGEVAHRVDLEG